MPGNGNGGGGQRFNPGLTVGEGGRRGAPRPIAPTPPPAPEPEPAPPPEPVWAENRQVANIDRTSRFAHAEYRSALESIHQQARAAGPAAEPMAQDFELPDIAFGERIY